jgi:hypothetical protein
MLVVIESHASNTFTWLAAWLTGFHAQSLESMSQFTGALVPLTPGESMVLAILIPIDNADVIGIELKGVFHEIGEE